MEITLFGKYSLKEIKINDIGLSKHINLQPINIPHSHGINTRKTGNKYKVNVVERLINKLIRSGQGKRKLSGKYIRGRKGCGKKLKMIKSMEKALEIVERETKQNPVQVLIKAIENSAPREDITRIKRGGIVNTQAVDVSPRRRIDEALKNLALAAFQKSFKSKVKVGEALANEILLAAKESNNSFAIKRRNEIERIALGSR